MDTAKTDARPRVQGDTADPFATIAKEPWLARLREGAKWNFYIEQFRLATNSRQSRDVTAI